MLIVTVIHQHTGWYRRSRRPGKTGKKSLGIIVKLQKTTGCQIIDLHQPIERIISERRFISQIGDFLEPS